MTPSQATGTTASADKLYAPFGCGALISRTDWLDAAPVYLPGGGAASNVRGESVVWAGFPARHEGGTPKLPGAVALAGACQAISELGWQALRAHPMPWRLAADGDALRPSTGIGTTSEHVARLLRALYRLAARGPQWAYAGREGRFRPNPNPPAVAVTARASRCGRTRRA